MCNREEPHIVKSLSALAKRLDVKCIVQVGAEDGWEAYNVHLATGARAIAIEADHRCVPCDPAVVYFHAIIGATDSQTEFFLNDNGGLSTHFARNSASEHLISEPQFRLDTFCKVRNIIPDALIIDTEGTTLEVLEGAGDLLNNVKLIYAECQVVVLRPGMRLIGEIQMFLKARGFMPHFDLPYYDGGAQGNYTFIRGKP